MHDVDIHRFPAQRDHVHARAIAGDAGAAAGVESSSPGFGLDLGGLGSLPSLPSMPGRIKAAVGRLTDRQLALGISAVLFTLGAWPVMTVHVPPLQDLPNHLATASVITHPDLYPEYVFNGFLKTNAALFTWLCEVGKVIGLVAAARIFLLLVLAANALVLPRFVLGMCEAGAGSVAITKHRRISGVSAIAESTASIAGERRKKMVVASLLAWPMVHNWFVSMGMLDFALAVPLSMVTLLLLQRQRFAPTVTRGLLIAAAGIATWYAHVFALMVVDLLVILEVLAPRGDISRLKTVRGWWASLKDGVPIVWPLVPTAALIAFSFVRHFNEPTPVVSFGTLLPAWELLYNLWAEWLYGFTWLSISTIVPAVALAYFGYKNRASRPMFFSPLALATLLCLYIFTPYVMTNWFHVNSRIAPYLWLAVLLRVPTELPKRAAGFLVLCAALYSAGMGIDYVRLDRDSAKFTAGISAVPQGARLLPLLFRRQETSENTRSLLHAWGYYVVEKQTSAPLLFAHSPSFPLTYKSPPSVRFNHLTLEQFASNMGSPAWMCTQLRKGGITMDDCDAAWRDRWAEFWKEATPEYDHVLMWDATPEALALVPADYRATFREDKLVVLERVGGGAAQVSARN